MSPSKVSTVQFDTFANIIDGKQVTSKNQHHGTNPSTGEQLWGVPIATQEDLNNAVASAKKAFETFSQTTIEERKKLLARYKDALLAHGEEMTDLLCAETGKPRAVAQIDSLGPAGWFDYYQTQTIPEDREEDDERVLITRYQPLGVVGAICPWNFPLILSLGKIIPAILTGNTIIVKPSPFTPYSTLKAVEIAQEVFPPGVISAVGGDDSLGPMLTAHPDIAKISFTGSIATGKKIMAACASTLKRVTLELGGNDASIVCPDVDVKKIAPELVLGAMQNSGQVCVATKRIYIHEDIYDELLAAMVEFTKNLKVGAPESGAPLGPIQNKMQYEKVKDFFADTKSKGYKFAVGEPDVAADKGFTIQPAIIDNPPDDSRIVQEEPFGPIVPTLKWKDEEDVIRRANATTTGLGGCVWSKDLDRAQRIAKRIDTGSVWINSYEKPTPAAFFGGHKESGIGGEWGKDGLKAYLNAQVLHIHKS